MDRLGRWPAGPPARPPSHACRRLSLVRRQVRASQTAAGSCRHLAPRLPVVAGLVLQPKHDLTTAPGLLGNPQRAGCLAPSVEARRLSLRPFGLRPGGPSKPATEPGPKPRKGARLGQPKVPSSLSPTRPPPQHGRPRAAGQGTSQWQVRVRLPCESDGPASDLSARLRISWQAEEPTQWTDSDAGQPGRRRGHQATHVGA